MVVRYVSKFITDVQPEKLKSESKIFDISDKIFHPLRMLILFDLAKHKEASFQELKTATRTTDGNLASHLRALEENGFVRYKKEINGKRVITFYQLTESGKDELNKLIEVLTQHLEKLKGDSDDRY